LLFPKLGLCHMVTQPKGKKIIRIAFFTTLVVLIGLGILVITQGLKCPEGSVKDGPIEFTQNDGQLVLGQDASISMENVTVSVPAKAIQAAGSLTITSRQFDLLPVTNDEWSRIQVFNVEYHDANGALKTHATFASPVEICIQVTQQQWLEYLDAPDDYQVQTYTENHKVWEALPLASHSSQSELCGETNQLSLFALAIRQHALIPITGKNPLVSTWYLAEGYTGDNFETYILVQNPNNTATQVNVTYMFQDGTNTRFITIPANARYTIVAQDADQVGPDQAFSTKVTADQPVTVERAMYWPNGDGTMAGHDTAGVTTPASTWYLAEGFTGTSAQTFILIQNPNNSAAQVNLTYMFQDGTDLTRTVSVPGNSRYTILANEDTQVGPDQAFSTKLTADLPIIAERTMYFSNEGHAANGITTPMNTWYLAEGYTGDGFETYILIQNPNDTEAHVDITYMLQNGSNTRSITIPAGSRFTILANENAQVGPNQAFSTKLTANQPIIVERAMYWPNGEGTMAGNDTTGITAPNDTWYLAEGYTGSSAQTFILLQNPNNSTAEVRITYMRQDGIDLNRTVSVPGNSRYTILANEDTQVGPDQAFSTKLEASLPIIVERAMYFNNGGHVASGEQITTTQTKNTRLFWLIPIAAIVALSAGLVILTLVLIRWAKHRKDIVEDNAISDIIQQQVTVYPVVAAPIHEGSL
jgi:hypothetical protein